MPVPNKMLIISDLLPKLRKFIRGTTNFPKVSQNPNSFHKSLYISNDASWRKLITL